MSGAVLTEWPAEGVLRLRLSNPGKKNAIDAALRDALRAEVEHALDEPSVRAIVLTGSDGEFSSGGDIHGLRAMDAAGIRERLQAGHRLLRRLHEAEKPVVAAIEGVAAGGGLALALCADVVVMGEGARVAFTFLRMGLIPDWGVLHTLPRRVGPAAARRLLLASRAPKADEALALGLADCVVPDAEVQTAALAEAETLAGQAPRAFGLTKRILQCPPTSLEGTLETELLAAACTFGGQEFREGTDAFLEKRPPRF